MFWILFFWLVCFVLFLFFMAGAYNEQDMQDKEVEHDDFKDYFKN